MMATNGQHYWQDISSKEFAQGADGHRVLCDEEGGPGYCYACMVAACGEADALAQEGANIADELAAMLWNMQGSSLEDRNELEGRSRRWLAFTNTDDMRLTQTPLDAHMHVIILVRNEVQSLFDCLRAARGHARYMQEIADAREHARYRLNDY
jgi:hypothetical protein